MARGRPPLGPGHRHPVPVSGPRRGIRGRHRTPGPRKPRRNRVVGTPVVEHGAGCGASGRRTCGKGPGPALETLRRTGPLRMSPVPTGSPDAERARTCLDEEFASSRRGGRCARTWPRRPRTWPRRRTPPRTCPSGSTGPSGPACAPTAPALGRNRGGHRRRGRPVGRARGLDGGARMEEEKPMDALGESPIRITLDPSVRKRFGRSRSFRDAG